MHPYLVPLSAPLHDAAGPASALVMQRYMKDIAPYFGIKTPLRRAILKAHVDRYGLPPIEELPAIARSAFAQREREWHYMAVDILVRMAKKMGPEHLPLLEELITTKSWWDTVDLMASNVVGVLLKRHPEAIPEWNKRWIESPDLWLNRTAILFQLKWKGDTDQALLFASIRRHAAHKDFFIRKAIGWALRELARTDPKAVRRFVADQPIAPLSRREALKHLVA